MAQGFCFLLAGMSAPFWMDCWWIIGTFRDPRKAILAELPFLSQFL